MSHVGLNRKTHLLVIVTISQTDFKAIDKEKCSLNAARLYVAGLNASVPNRLY